ncbi:MAG: hypothetical protein CL814_12290 [Confluentimicrobium sp.]|jgi:hypothetical protein|uniref:Hint domain-containing protein n=1 Tax=Actibacterium sp. TaxID=1872125 RepID=UPI00068F7474|nr:Hint domain-containing protein [Actibacterium sp.]MBC57698.1 hypothetical protein [Actibacterium sp.]MDY6857965.1 Hint domain-containing protein [Pseudomonadota bacterium]
MANIIGDNNDNVLNGTNAADCIDGKGGDDTINGLAGNDTLLGGTGDDTILGGAGDDCIDGGDDDDHLFGEDGNDFISGGCGDDAISGGAGADYMSGGSGDDIFFDITAGDHVDGGSGCDTLDLSGTGAFCIIYTSKDHENGIVKFIDDAGNFTGTMTFCDIEDIIVCFTPGTTVATLKGARPVEALQPGDRVITRDNGVQEIRWSGRRDLTGEKLRDNPDLRPILIRAGAFGDGAPLHDMMVSPSHRMLLASKHAQLYFDEHEVLVAAKHLLHMPGVERVGPQPTSYIHFLFDRHEVVLANGAWTESFQPGDYSMQGLGDDQRSEIFQLFPELETRAGLQDYSAARKTLKKHEARLLAG